MVSRWCTLLRGARTYCGYAGKKFAPELAITRAQLVMILYRAQEGTAMRNVHSFDDDVKPGDWYYDAVMWAESVGVVTGYDDKNFGPNDSITREQFAAILYRYAAYKGYRVTKRNDFFAFADHNRVQPYAQTAMEWAYGEMLITGVTETRLDPQGGNNSCAGVYDPLSVPNQCDN